jgi:hypothetical protein
MREFKKKNRGITRQSGSSSARSVPFQKKLEHLHKIIFSPAAVVFTRKSQIFLSKI